MRQLMRAVSIAGIGALAACSAGPEQRLQVATGAVSHFLCTGTFVTGEQPDRIYADTIQPLPAAALLGWGLSYQVDAAHREVRTTFLGGFQSRAVYRQGLGCMISNGNEPGDGDLSARVAVPDSPAKPPLLPEIAGPAVVVPTDPRLVAALDHAFAEPDHPPYRRTKAVVVVHDGRVIAERYAPGYGIDTPLLGNSVTKSAINALVGILVRDGKLAVNERAPVAAWQDAADRRGAITLDDLLRMRSGLDLGDSLGADMASVSNRMLFVERDMAGFGERAALQAPPGTVWTYADGNYLILSRIIRDAVGGSAGDVLRFAHRELFERLGMRHVTLGFDATGTPVGAVHMLASARDWARLGMLYRDDGAIEGQRILPAGWVRYSSAPTAGAWVGYGAGFWTNGDASFGARKRIGLGMPSEAFFARGKFGQYLVIVPSAKLVVARFGVTHGDEDIEGISRLVAEVIAALGAATDRAALVRQPAAARGSG